MNRKNTSFSRSIVCNLSKKYNINTISLITGINKKTVSKYKMNDNNIEIWAIRYPKYIPVWEIKYKIANLENINEEYKIFQKYLDLENLCFYLLSAGLSINRITKIICLSERKIKYFKKEKKIKICKQKATMQLTDNIKEKIKLFCEMGFHVISILLFCLFYFSNDFNINEIFDFIYDNAINKKKIV